MAENFVGPGNLTLRKVHRLVEVFPESESSQDEVTNE